MRNLNAAAGKYPFFETSLHTRRYAMHFCLTGQYTPQSLKNLMANPQASRYEAAKSSIEAAGGKMIAMYGMPAEGPGVLVIFDVPEPGAAAAAIAAVVISAGVLHNVKLVRLLTMEEVTHVRQIASKVNAAYKPPQ
jgi:uncharacterized protein with GYD domain